LKLKFIAALDS